MNSLATDRASAESRSSASGRFGTTGGSSAIVLWTTAATLCFILNSLPARATTGRVLAWGSEYYTNVPVTAVNLKAIAAGEYYNLGLRADGTIVALGGSASSVGIPFGLTNVTAICTAGLHVLALRTDGTVAGWGSSEEHPYCETAVPSGLTGVTAIATGRCHSLVLYRNGTVRAWGAYGGTNVLRGLTEVVAIGAGNDFNVALRADGTVVTWGGSWCDPVAVPPGLSNIVAISTANDHTLAMKADGTLIDWNSDGTIQTGTPTNLTDVVAISAGYWHDMVLKSDGSVVTWEWNWPDPDVMTVPASCTNIIAISAGPYVSLALRGDWPPTILDPPVSQSVFTSRACALEVSANTSAEMCFYQWQLNGIDIPGATNSLLQLAAVGLSDAGQYTVVVSNELGYAISSAAMLSVLESAPFVTRQPESQPLVPGLDVVLAIEVDGSGPFQYQWRFNGTNILDATNATLVISRPTYGRLGNYDVVIKNLVGSVTSEASQLYLGIHADYASPADPLIWDFSGTYPSPLWTTLWQSKDGKLAASSGGWGNVFGDGRSVKINLSSERLDPYWLDLDTVTVEYVFYASETVNLTLDPATRSLSGWKTRVEVGQKYAAFLWCWAPYCHLSTNQSRYSVALALPNTVTGAWSLDVQAIPSGTRRLSGRAMVKYGLTNMLEIPCAGSRPTINQSVLVCGDPTNHLKVVGLGSPMRVQSLSGIVAGQKLAWKMTPVWTPLSLTIQGNGSIGPLTNGQTLLAGRNFSLQARPKKGNRFVQWNAGGFIATNRVLSFTMAPNLAIEAEFATNSPPSSH